MPAAKGEAQQQDGGWDDPQRWVWMDEPPTIDQAMERLATVPKVHGVRVVDYADYVLPMMNRQKFEENGVTKYRPTWRLYCQVAGRILMLHEAQGHNDWIVDEEQVFTLETSPAVVRINIAVFGRGGENLKLGNRWGISKLKGGDSAWEKAETAARGRALGAWGFGVLPGSGIASLDEMQDVRDADVSGDQPQEPSTREELVELTMTAIEELRAIRDQDPKDLYSKLAGYVHQHMGAEIAAGPPLDLSELKPGQLQLLLRNVRKQIRQETQAGAPY